MTAGQHSGLTAAATSERSVSSVAVRPSAAGELFWALERIERSHKRIRQPHLELPQRVPPQVKRHVAEFWSDGVSGFMELMVLADWAGQLFGTDPERVLGIVEPQSVEGGDQPAFASELPEERDQIHQRLERLRADERLRARLGESARGGIVG